MNGKSRPETTAGLLSRAEEMTVPWTEAELDRLKMMVRQKASAADIAKSLGRRVGSVKTKVREMGLVPLKKPRLRPSAGL